MITRLPRTALLVVLAAVLACWAVGGALAQVTPAEQTAMLTAHNTLRRSVAAAETRRLGQTVTIPDLTWNPTAAATAQAWAATMLSTNNFDHNPNRGDLGEDIYMETGGNSAGSGDRAFKLWADEASSYNWTANSCADICGHYTQIVWAATTSVGCGKATNGSSTYWVCDYAPPGNFSGQRPYEPSGAAALGNAQPAGSAVTYAAGWNIVAGPSGTTFPQASRPLYTIQAGDTGYEALAAGAPVVSGRGYWAYFASAAPATLAGSGAASVSVAVPAGQWILVGNPSATATLTVHGADVVYVWDPAANQFQQTTSLPAGRGAWVFSTNGGTVTLS